MPPLSRIGEQLRSWRKRRGLSQLDLAIAASTTSRYVSFVETGRSRPGRGVVLRLAEALELSLRDQNALLVAAGLAPMYSERALDEAEMAPVRRVIEHVLANHEPYPGWAIGPGLRMLGSNRAAERVFPGMTELTPMQLVEAWCTPDPRDSVAAQRIALHQAVASLRKELVHHPHPDLPALVARAEELAGRLGPIEEVPDRPVLCPTLRIDGRQIRTLATVLRFDKPTDVTMAELRVELVFPADDEAERFFRDAAA